MRLLLAGVLLTLTACGTAPASTPAGPGSEPAGVHPADAPALLAAAADRAREAGQVRYAGVVESSRDGQPTAVDARLEGGLDLRADAGTVALDLVALADLVAMEAQAAEQDGVDVTDGAPDLGDLARTRLSWTAGEVTVHVGDVEETQPRGSTDTGMLARVPDEPGGLLDVVATATDVRVVGEEEVDGVATTRVEGTVDPRAAVETGLGTSGQLSIAEMASLPIEVWLDAAGLPRRVRYTVALPSLAGGTRTTVTTYDYRGWGEPVDLTG